MTKYRVIGGLTGSYQPSYQSPIVDTKREAKEIFKENYQRDKEEANMPMSNTRLVDKGRDYYELDDGSMGPNFRVEIVEIDEIGGR